MQVILHIKRESVGFRIRTGTVCMRADVITVTSEVGATMFARERTSSGLFRVDGDGIEYTDVEVLAMLEQIAQLDVKTDTVRIEHEPPTFRHPSTMDVDDLNADVASRPNWKLK